MLRVLDADDVKRTRSFVFKFLFALCDNCKMKNEPTQMKETLIW